MAQTTGMHSVNVFFAGQQIPKSPFGVKVTPGKITNSVTFFHLTIFDLQKRKKILTFTAFTL